MRSFVARKLEGMLSRSLNSQKMLEQVDLYKLYLRTNFCNTLKAHGQSEAVREFQRETERLASKSPAVGTLRDIVQQNVHAQVASDFDGMAGTGVRNVVCPSTPTSSPAIASFEAEGGDLQAWVRQRAERERQWKQAYANYDESARKHTEQVLSMPITPEEKAMESVKGFFLRRGKSCVPFAGDGLFVVGSAPPGTVVCLYPGVVYHPWDVRKIPGGLKFFSDNFYLIARFDSLFIDGCNPSPALAGPFGLGHLINHPPHGGKPNVMPYSYDVPASLDPKLHSMIPNVYFSQPPLGTEIYLMKTLALVTLDNVSNCELFLNYRMNPKLKYPTWYSSVDQEEDRMRWTQ